MGSQLFVDVPPLPTQLDLRNDEVNTLVSFLLQVEDRGGVLDEDTGETNEVEVHIDL